MKRAHRIILTGAAVLATVTACAGDSVAPNTAADEADFAAITTIDPTLGAAAGQASLPGLTMEPEATYEGSVGANDRCSYVPADGRVVCTPVTRGGITITRSFAFHDAADAPQPSRDANTRSTNVQVGVKGTVTLPRGSLTVDRASSLTVAGLGPNTTSHTLSGTESGTSSGSFTTDRGTISWSETSSSTTRDVVVPVPLSRGSWPLSGTTTRTATVTITRPDADARTTTWSETVKFNGTKLVEVVIMRDGVTRTCTRDLTTHRLSCS